MMHDRASELIASCRAAISAKGTVARNALQIVTTTIQAVFDGDTKRAEPHLKHVRAIYKGYLDSEEGDVELLFDQLAGALVPLELLAQAGGANRKRRSGLSGGIGQVFVVHGHKLDLRDRVSAWLKTVGLKPVVLSEQPGSSKTVIELIEQYSGVDHAICLLTADDVGGVNTSGLRPRARQNVVLEVGYFFALLGRGNVSVVADSEIELPSDILGLRPIVLFPGVDLEARLQEDLQHCGILPTATG